MEHESHMPTFASGNMSSGRPTGSNAFDTPEGGQRNVEGIEISQENETRAQANRFGNQTPVANLPQGSNQPVDASEIQKLTRVHAPDNEPSKVYQEFSASDLPGVRFTRWLNFKNRFGDEDLNGIAVEVLIGPPDMRTDISVDDYRRTLANGIGTNNTFPPGLHNSSRPTTSTETMVHRVRILSAAVRKRLSSIMGSDKNWETRPITFLRPFREFISYHDKMKMELQYAQKSATQTSFQDEHKDLSNYIAFVEKIILPLKAKWDPGQPRMPLRIPCVDLWYIFRHGEFYYSPAPKDTVSGRSEASRILVLLSIQTATHDRRFTEYASSQISTTWGTSWSCGFISFDFDGRAFRPVYTYIDLHRYEGEKDIRSLPVWPLRFEPEGAKILTEYQRYGRKFTGYCSSRRHWFHSGWTLDWKPRRGEDFEDNHPRATLSEFIDSEVIVDFQEALRSFADWSPKFLQPVSEHSAAAAVGITDSWQILTWGDQGSTVVTSRVSESVVFDSGLELRDENHALKLMPLLGHGTAQKEELEDSHFALLPRRVFAYSLRDRKFVLAHVDSLSEVKYVDGGFKNLRIHPPHLRMIKSLVKNHFNTKRFEALEGVELTGQDFIYGKGRGVVMLLHGVPGVGKTATAEAVAQEYAKPLFPMTCGDLGTTPEVVSRNLLDIFRLANLWECVLLLDEAEVFLSRRELRSNDLLRNALVSVFLRVMEYYSGILFLTTNRPGVLDEAVKSRVHASFYYPHLGWDQTRDIFELNIERLRRIEDQRSKYGKEALVILNNQIMKFAEDHYKNHNENEGRWNGRQIRNAFQIAAGLAHLDGEEATEELQRSGKWPLENVSEGNGATGGVQRQLGRQHFQEVAEAILKYDQFRAKVLGKYDNEIARDRNERPEEFPEGQSEGSNAHGHGEQRIRGDYGGVPGPYERYVRYDAGPGYRGFER